MPETPTVKTLSTSQTTLFRPGGEAVAVIRTRWMYGAAHGPYTTDIPVAEFSAQRLQQEQQRLVAELQRLT